MSDVAEYLFYSCWPMTRRNSNSWCRSLWDGRLQLSTTWRMQVCGRWLPSINHPSGRRYWAGKCHQPPVDAGIRQVDAIYHLWTQVFFRWTPSTTCGRRYSAGGCHQPPVGLRSQTMCISSKKLLLSITFRIKDHNNLLTVAVHLYCNR